MSQEDDTAKQAKPATPEPNHAPRKITLADLKDRQSGLATEAWRTIERSGASRQMEELRRQQEVLRLAGAPSDELRRLAAEAQFDRDRWRSTVGASLEMHGLGQSASRYQELMTQTLGSSAGLQRVMENIRPHQELARLATGHLDELRREGFFAGKLSAEFARASTWLVDFEKRFKLPEIGEAWRLTQSLDSGRIAGIVGSQFFDGPSLKRAMETMQSPWLDQNDRLRSIQGFAELQSIGQALRMFPAFDDRVADALRSDLGDWRQPVEWPASIANDPVARSAFYVERGFNSALTDLPAPAFEESVSIAGLSGPLLFIEGYGAEADADVEEEEGCIRTNEAHDRLMRFERRVRRFIDTRMREVAGEHWVKHRVPGPMRAAWEDKRQKQLDSPP